jgi:hypothetical protein
LNLWNAPVHDLRGDRDRHDGDGIVRLDPLDQRMARQRLQLPLCQRRREALHRAAEECVRAEAEPALQRHHRAEHASRVIGRGTAPRPIVGGEVALERREVGRALERDDDAAARGAVLRAGGDRERGEAHGCQDQSTDCGLHRILQRGS